MDTRDNVDHARDEEPHKQLGMLAATMDLTELTAGDKIEEEVDVVRVVGGVLDADKSGVWTLRDGGQTGHLVGYELNRPHRHHPLFADYLQSVFGFSGSVIHEIHVRECSEP